MLEDKRKMSLDPNRRQIYKKKKERPGDDIEGKVNDFGRKKRVIDTSRETGDEYR